MTLHRLRSLAFLPMLLLTTPAAYASAVYNYKIDGFSGNQTQCHTAAELIAERFADVTGYKVEDVACKSVSTLRQDILIQYHSEVEAKLVSSAHSSIAFQGMFHTLHECERSLPDEQKLFEQRTGLKAVAALCLQERVQKPYDAYSARIEGFGSPLMRPFTLLKTIYGVSEYTPAQVRDLLASSLADIPGVFGARIYSSDGEFGTEVVVKYYSTRSRALALILPASFEDTQTCRRYRNEVAAMLRDLGVLGARTICARKTSSTVASDLHVFGLISIPYKVEYSPTSFTSRQQCETARVDLAGSNAREHTVVRAKGLCVYETDEVTSKGRYRLKLFQAQ